MASKKELLKEINKKYNKEELIEKCKDLVKVSSSMSKKKILERIGKLKNDDIEKILKPESKEEVITISLKPNKWMIPAIGLIIVAVITYSGLLNGQAPATSTGMAVITYLTDNNCNTCFDVTLNEVIMDQIGLDYTTESYDVNSAKGIELINKYNIQKIPAFIITGESATSNTDLMTVWSQVGSQELDGALVFRAPEVFLDEGDHKILNDDGEFELYIPPETTIGSFMISETEPCYNDNGSPIVYFFGSTTCPYCAWEHPVVGNATTLFGDAIEYHDNMASQNDTDVFMEFIDYNPNGGVPFLIIGCKYLHIGAGQLVVFDNETMREVNKTHPEEVSDVMVLLDEADDLRSQAMIAYQANDTETYESLAINYTNIINEASSEVEKLVIIDLICNLTNNEPASVC